MGISNYPEDHASTIEDARIMGEELGRLRGENGDLKRRLSKAEDLQKFGSYTGAIVLLILLCSTLLGTGYPIYKTATTPRKIERCLIERSSVGAGSEALMIYKVIGVVDWGADVTQAVFLTFDEARKAAESTGCPTRITP